MSDMMTFPNTVKEFMEQYKIIDTEKIYTNGTELIPIFRMMQWFEHVSATDKNVATTDYISRQAAIDGKISIQRANGVEIYSDEAVPVEYLKALPPVQPAPFGAIEHAGLEHPLSDEEIIPRLRDIQAQVGGSYAIDRAIELLTAPLEQHIDEWCTDCKEYDKEKHSCPRWNRVIRQTLADAQPQRTGYWYPVGMAEVVGGESAMWGSAVAYHKCSECDEQALKDDFEQEVLSKWCPHCEAKMEGVSE